MRLIDADKLYEKLLSDTMTTFMVHGGGQYIDSSRVVDAINEATTITYEDLAPHGRWKVRGQDLFCTNCGGESGYNAFGASAFSDYCPKCGAKMDK
jgi:hypothetical protein